MTDTAKGLILGLLYVATARLGLELATINLSASPVWPATGLAISSLYIFGRRYAVAIFAGAIIANLLSGLPWSAALIIGIGNTLEALLGAYLIKSIGRLRSETHNHSDALGIISASAAGGLISALIGTVGLVACGQIARSAAPESFVTWWVGDVLGGLIVAPLLIAMARPNFLTWTGSRTTLLHSATAWIFLTFTITFFLFGGDDPRWAFLLFPCLLVVCQWLGARALLLTVLLTSAAAIAVTLQGVGPFHWGSLNTNLINLQLFLAGVSITSLVLIGIATDGALKQATWVLIPGWSVSALLVISFVSAERSKDSDRISALVSDITDAIGNRFAHYEDALRSGASLFQASEYVEPWEWRTFVDNLDVRTRYPGVRGLGVIFPVDHLDLADFQTQQRKFDSDFQIHPLGGHDQDFASRAEHFIITYIEPKSDNKSAAGLDVSSEPNRRAAAQLARDTGVASITNTIHLVQDEKSRAGFLFYFPFYLKKNLSTAQERRRYFKGWIYAPFVTDELFSGVLGDRVRELEFSVFDRPYNPDEKANPVFATTKTQALTKPERLTELTLGQQNFQIAWYRSDKFVSAHDTTAAWVGFVGTIITLLVAGLISTLDTIRLRAQNIADRQTELLKQSQQKMIAASHLSSLGEMAAGVAHEINNPLAVLSLKLELIRSEIESNKINASTFEKISGAEKMITRIATIVSNLRTFGRDGSHDPHNSVSLKDIIDDAVSLCGARFHHNDIDLKVAAIQPSHCVRVRSVQISQVLVNLLNNSFDAVMGVDHPRVEISVDVDQKWAKLRVIDNGCGIPKSIRDKIMLPFFTTKEVGRGTGLGLSIAKGIILDHGGTLELEDGLPHTSFALTLPLA